MILIMAYIDSYNFRYNARQFDICDIFPLK